MDTIQVSILCPFWELSDGKGHIWLSSLGGLTLAKLLPTPTGSPQGVRNESILTASVGSTETKNKDNYWEDSDIPLLEGLPSQAVICQNSCICIGGLSKDSRQEECQVEILTL